MRTRWYVLLGVVVLAVLLLGSGREASAHAVLRRSVPEANSELTASPPTMEIWFSEPIEAEFSGAELLDGNGNTIPTDAAISDSNDPYHLTIPLPPLEPGIYTLAWHNLSIADGHQWQGAIPFTILLPDGTRPDGTAANLDALSSDEQPSPGLVLARWLQLVGAMLLFGVPLFRIAVEREENTLPPHWYRRFYLVGVATMLIGVVLTLVLQSSTLGGTALIVNFLTKSRTGQLMLVRAGLSLLFAVAVVAPVRGTRYKNALLLVIAALVLFTFSFGSHAAAANGSVWAIAVDYIHLVGAAAWVGGLWCLPFALGAWRTTRAQKPPVEVLRRFSGMAFGLIALLAATGIFSSLVQIPDFNALVSTRYGQTLLVKLAVTAAVLLLAWRNRALLHGQVQKLYQAEGQQRLRRQLLLESSIVVVLIATVALLVQTTVPRTLPQDESFTESIVEADDLTIHLQVSPNHVGYNRFLVHLYHEDSTPIGDVQAVRLIFKYQNEEIGNTTAELTSVNRSIFETEGSYFSRPGDWMTSVYVRRRGMDDVLVNMPFQVEPAAPPTTPLGNPIPTIPPFILLGGAIVVLGGAAWFARSQIPPLWQRRWLYSSMVVVGIGLVVGIEGYIFQPAPELNPEPPATLENVAAGGALYATNCSGCHGENGLGNGPQAAGMVVPPANLVDHVPAHTNRGLYQFVQFGFPDAGMPAFGQTLSNDELWAIVHYIRAEYGQGEMPSTSP